jgi:hypothetical protein
VHDLFGARNKGPIQARIKRTAPSKSATDTNESDNQHHGDQREARNLSPGSSEERLDTVA